MSTYVNITGRPEDVTAAGARLKAEAESLKSQAQTLLSDISSIDGKAPWGQDAPGKQLAQQYNQVPENGGKPFSDSLKETLGEAGDQLGKIGDGIMLAMGGYQGTDAANQGDINKVKH